MHGPPKLTQITNFLSENIPSGNPAPDKACQTKRFFQSSLWLPVERISKTVFSNLKQKK
jgi:hypothetical protein